MNKYNEFLNEIKQLNIEVAEYCFLNGAGWVKSKDYPELPTGLKKKYRWNLTALKESELKMLQSSAINELALLSEDQMQMQLKRLDFINEFDRFFDFVKQFYVKFEKNNCTGLDISDFKMKLESCFYCEIPEKGNLDIDFLNELLNDLFIKSAIFDGLKYQLKQLAPSEPQQETKKGEPIELTAFFTDEVEDKTIEAIQNKFKDYKGKKLAILIYLLTMEYKYVEIDNNDRKKNSRIHFVRCLKNDHSIKIISGINNYIEGTTGTLKRIDNNDTAYLRVAKELEEMFSSVQDTSKR